MDLMRSSSFIRFNGEKSLHLKVFFSLFCERETERPYAVLHHLHVSKESQMRG